MVSHPFAHQLLSDLQNDTAQHDDTQIPAPDKVHSFLCYVEALTRHELEVPHLISSGFTNQEIASKLFLSPNTVKVHTRNIYGKLDAHHRAEAVARARALGILPSA